MKKDTKTPLGKDRPAKRNHFRSNIVKSFKRLNLSEILKKAIPYIIFGYFGNKFTYAFRLTQEKNFAMRLVKSLGRFGQAFENLMPSFNGYDLLGGVITGVALWLVVYLKKKNAKKFRHGLEYGSARWGSRKDIIPYMDEDDPDNNMIITKTESVRLNGRPKSIEYAVNKNVMVIGGSGSGKTRFFVKPQIMQLHSSYIISDPKG